MQDFDLKTSHPPGDFRVYLHAVERVNLNLDPYVPTDSSPYKYSPGALAPFFLLPKSENQAWLVFKLFCIAGWVVAILLAAPLKTWQNVMQLIVAIIISWKGLLETLDYGQIEFVLLLGCVLAARLAKRNYFLSGLILGTFAWLKLPWGLMAIPFLFSAYERGKEEFKRTLAGYFTGNLLVGTLIPCGILGCERAFELTRSWVFLLKTQPRDLYLSDLNQSIWSTLVRWHAYFPILGDVAGLLFLLSFLYLGMKLSRRRSLPGDASSLLGWMTPGLILTQLVNPLSWRWGSMLLIGVPFSVKPGLLFSRASPGALFLPMGIFIGTILLFLLQQNPIVQFIGLTHWTDLHRFGLITVYWLFMLALCVEGIDAK